MISVPEKVILHPLVLLSVVDHYTRTAHSYTSSKRRVVGLLLGDVSKGEVEVTNSFALPFEEDEKKGSIWFLDHSYLESMYAMFRKVNAREKIIGWYSTGPELKEADLDIHELIGRFCDDPVFVICEVQPKETGLPFKAYFAVDEVKAAGTEKSKKVFLSLATQVGQTEAEEIGVEHLLRDVKDATISTLTTDVAGKLLALKGLQVRLCEMQKYLSAVVDGTLPLNQDIMAQVQEIFNLLPNTSMKSMTEALAVKANDMTEVVYIAALVRSILALHKLIDNKERRVQDEKKKNEAVVAAAAASEASNAEKKGSGAKTEEGAADKKKTEKK
mmetsp:Transcript_23489/g.41775  ORF Transcript_23489/g.41775 Transcript_23489/m.41775 type:complete len:330 (-) Transcript_23489:406-1395(-)|eukprot:CAMPEP_0175073738 /NCGR_PEP_ID=MMETSP0052_2-20121109/20785_1 /TAXON_ID=51329 ORGANISM="Polytomella parva, Strain SAG 63-3" /NCGR_SAMPLE_ID=MMETSP0052_2 /ASSEMBLY_ACC=CAM_ASM_000194 /LENGTH=329 /DNA_ID=CAMNT_0016341693 /DNA_START=36 /DNA_END=1025 /DNA_ORIENTATION=-